MQLLFAFHALVFVSEGKLEQFVLLQKQHRSDLQLVGGTNTKGAEGGNKTEGVDAVICGGFGGFQQICGTYRNGRETVPTKNWPNLQPDACKALCAAEGTAGCCESRTTGFCRFLKAGTITTSPPHTDARSTKCVFNAAAAAKKAADDAAAGAKKAADDAAAAATAKKATDDATAKAKKAADDATAEAKKATDDATAEAKKATDDAAAEAKKAADAAAKKAADDDAEAKKAADKAAIACENPGHSTLPTCTLPVQGYCNGRARLGYGTKWSDWKDVSGAFLCTNDFFAEDPWQGQAKVCVCEAAATTTTTTQKYRTTATAGLDCATGRKITTSSECQAAANQLNINWNPCCQSIDNEVYGCFKRADGDIIFNGKVKSPKKWGHRKDRWSVCTL